MNAQKRLSGQFYTPTEWVDEAHKMLDEQLGPGVYEFGFLK